MAVQSLKSLFPKLVANYGDDVAEGLVKYGDEAADWASSISTRGKPKFFNTYVYDNFKEGLPIKSVPEDPYFSNIFEKPYLQQRVPRHIFPKYSRSGSLAYGDYSLKELLEFIREDSIPF